MIHRHFTADSLNLVANDPSVYDWVRGAVEGRLDLTPVIHNEDNILLMGEYGGVLFIKIQQGIYEAHTQVLPQGRGQWCVDTVNECLHYMFTKTDALEIVTRVPKGNLPARALAKTIHGTQEFRIDRGWVYNGGVVFADVFRLGLQDWMAKAPGLEAKGEWFHQHLLEEYKRFDYVEQQHPNDPLHDRYVGATTEMIMGGQAPKAVIFYNRWAGITGYQPIKLVSLDPVVIDIQESLISLRDNSFWVLRVR